MDNREKPNAGAFISPYLRTRLRSLEEVERARERAQWRLRRTAVLDDWLREGQAESPPPAVPAAHR